MSIHCSRSKRTPFRKNVINKISRKSNLNRTSVLDRSFAMGLGALQNLKLAVSSD